MFRRSIWGAAVLVAFVFAGCGAQPGKTYMTYNRGKTPPPVVEAEESGSYRLFASNSANALFTTNLEKGDQFGFRQSGEKVVAVAKDKEIPLENMLATSYYWKRETK